MKIEKKSKMCRQSEVRFHCLAPDMIDAGPAAGKFLAFSHARTSHLANGSVLNLFSLKEQKVVLQIPSGEAFVDFISDPNAALQSKGRLYFLSDS